LSHKEHFKVSGYEFHLDKETVEQKLATIKAEPITKVYVRVGDKDFPVKQVLSEAVPRLIRSRIGTQAAVRVLAALGFNPKEKKTREEPE
jgi:hypothetical protein